MRVHLEAKNLYRMLNAVLLTGLFLFGLGSYFGIAKVEAVHIVVALVAMSVLTLFQAMSAKGRIVLVLGGMGCLGITMFVAGLRKSAWFLLSYVNWLSGERLINGASGILWPENWTVGYEILQVILVVLICYILQVLLEKEFRIKLVSALLLVAGLVYCYLAKKELSHGAVTLAIGYLLMVFTEWTQLHWEKKKSRSMESYMLWMTPFIAGYLVVLLCIPTPQKPYDWQIFKDTYAKISSSLHTISMNIFSFGREDFDQSLSGFSENGRLVGGVSDSKREIMRIQSDGGVRSNVYLTGRVYDTFDGSQWKQENEDDTPARFLDTVQTMYAIRRFDKEYQQDYMYRGDLKISYEDFRTKYLFAPLKTYSLENRNRPLAFEKSGDGFLFDAKKGYGTEYDVAYYQLNVGQQAFVDFLNGQRDEDETILQEILMSLNSRMDVELTKDDLEKQAQRVYHIYLSDVALSTEAAAYLERITQNAETDAEKLYAIEAALATGEDFVYTKSPGKLPDSVSDAGSFLDYFLLESRQGYCSYFATAFCLLARAEGIPARYVQGYCVPMGTKEEVMVTSDMAHAWPEVYLDGIGWIPFEPTPGYGELRYTPWALKKGETASKTDSGGYYAKDWELEEEETEETPGDFAAVEITGKETNTIDFEKVLWILLTSLVLIFVVAFFMILLDRCIIKYRYSKLDESEKYRMEVGKNLRILAWLLVEKREDETLEELRKRVVLLPDEELHFLSQYEEFLYGNRQVSGHMMDLTLKEQEQLLQILKQKKPWTYWYYRIWS